MALNKILSTNLKKHKTLEEEFMSMGVANEARDAGVITRLPLEMYLDKIITECDKVKQLKQKAKKLSLNPHINVLILGNTGTGKELFARVIHGNSHGKFIGINTAGIPEPLLESELFGHVKGAFTGAFNEKHGLIEEAKNGTLFLDEIGEMPMLLQSKLLRALEEKMARKVGDTKEYPIHCRIVAATNRLSEKNHSLRKDLYYRLAGSILELPDLIERDKDWMLITRNILGTNFEGIPYQLETKLQDAASLNRFDGNIRQLINLIQEWLVLEKDEN